MRRLATRVSGERRVAFFQSWACAPRRGGWRRSPRRRGFVACRRRRQDESAPTARSAAQRSANEGTGSPRKALAATGCAHRTKRREMLLALRRCRDIRAPSFLHGADNIGRPAIFTLATPEESGPHNRRHGRAGRSCATVRRSRSDRLPRCGASALTAFFLTIFARVSARCSHGKGAPADVARRRLKEGRSAPRAEAPFFEVRDAPSLRCGIQAR